MKKGSKHTEEARRKISLNGFHYGMLGKKATTETKKKMSIAQKGRLLGVKLSLEHREKLSNARKLFYENGGIHPKGMLGKTPWNKGLSSTMSERTYSKKLFHARQRKVEKRTNGGHHTLGDWDELKKFYNYMCLCCKQQEPFVKLTEDHVVPISAGGTNYISNIQPLCQRCNSLKWTKTIDYRVPSPLQPNPAMA